MRAPLATMAARRPTDVPAIELTGLSKRFQTAEGTVQAIERVTFAVASGDFVCLVGPSGCGKSTLLNIIAGLLPASAGEVRICGEPGGSVRPDRIGYVFQRDALLPWKTALQNVMLPLLLRGVPPAESRETARHWVHKVGLAGFEHHYPSQLSGGMRKRIALAMTMVYRPSIILMDEPFAALDVQTRNLMENELLALWAETGSAILFVTHDLEEAIALADRIVVLTAAPARVRCEYPVPLERPRDVAEIRTTSAFLDIYRHIWRDLREEVAASHGRR
ncbi:MAG: ABC transporter ATP-binding protein [Armatimonadota bacterium]|nr:ABC transporter ATP-binding protein [Armatimonadota bacterium]MDR7428160.1 ABC transporter ATP-binding protein [Armatimonadota bacterium]MDR7464725.1 ABC transporter ATP-binding protein [Armatimonadota bacterium]MDR7469787.1 ABC transporter ATP-binding protein [Armatimonadota bacterium]MDR7474686.1 ABC transporter ATP-binding protein [Armatimonadota bacterium]